MTTESKMSRVTTRSKDGSEKTRSLQNGFERIAAIFWPRNFVQAEKIVEEEQEEGFCLQPCDNWYDTFRRKFFVEFSHL